ncbi:MAG: 30S ribosomal protein S7 [Patescibacteria group bacterium]
MRRKRKIEREIQPDPKYGNVAIAKLINYVMRKGKKSTATGVVYRTFGLIEQKYKQDPLKVFEEAMRHMAPMVEVRSRRVGGASYQVPREVRGNRQTALAYRWLLGAARSQKGKPMHEKLAAELIAASKNEGTAVKKKQDVHRMAESNKAFAHMGW